MRITIDYEASWRNSFLDGDNNLPIPKQGRKYIGSGQELSKAGNYLKREITIDTVMGLLNRLIGCQQRLYQARNCQFESSYYFADLEQQELVTFEDRIGVQNDELVYLRNMTGSTDQNSFTGMIRRKDPAFSSPVSRQLWAPLQAKLGNLLEFILNPQQTTLADYPDPNPLGISNHFNELGKIKPVPDEGEVSDAVESLQSVFQGAQYANAGGKIIVSSLYCSALYLQLRELQAKPELVDQLSKTLTNSGGLPGISKRGFTKKDFMDRYTTGKKKLVYGNPYVKTERIKGEGEVKSYLRKASGQLVIHIDVPPEKGREIKQMIERAGVSSFYLGKKGLVYVREIRI